MSTPRFRQFLALFGALALGLGLMSFAAPAQAQTDGIEEARERAEAAAQALSDAETALGEMDSQIAELEAQTAAAERELARLGDSVQELVIAQYMSSGDIPMLTETDLNDGVKAQAYSRYVGQGSLDEIDQYLEAKAELDDAGAELTTKRAEQTDRIEDLDQAIADMQAEIERLEELERQRQAELERQRQAEAAAAAEAERSAAAAAAAAVRAQSQRQVRPQSQAQATQTQAPAQTPSQSPTQTTPAPAPAPAPRPSSGGGMICPVAGPHSFIDSWGAPRSGGRSHKGVDMMASNGTPAVAPVSGVVTHRGNSIGGLSYHLDGDDGNYYYGTHLSSYAQSGRVSAGTVIGYVGSTGNAGSPHLHFEIHPNASSYSTPVNPYPATRAACG